MVWRMATIKCLGIHTDVCNGWGDSDFDTRVSLFSEFSLEEFVQFGVEDTVGDELAALRDGTLLSGHLERLCRSMVFGSRSRIVRRMLVRNWMHF